VIRRHRNAWFVGAYVSGAESEQGKAPGQLTVSATTGATNTSPCKLGDAYASSNIKQQ